MNIITAADANKAGVFGKVADGTLVGVRPEEVKVGSGQAAGVVIVEPVGSHTILTLDVSGASLRAVVPGTWSGGSSTKVEVPASSLHHFDAATGARK